MVDRKELNLFQQEPVQGALAMYSAGAPALTTFMVDPDTPLVTGGSPSVHFKLQPSWPVVLAEGEPGVPKVTFAYPTQSGWPDIYGLICFNPKQVESAEGDVVQVATKGAVMWVKAGEEIEAGDKVAPAGREESGKLGVVFIKVATAEPIPEGGALNGFVGVALTDAEEGEFFMLEIGVPVQTSDYVPTPPGPELLTIFIEPSALEMTLPETVDLTATGHYSDESIRNITEEVNWSSDDPGVVVVNPQGQVTSVSYASTTIRANLDGVEASIPVNVVLPTPTLVGVSITPNNLTLPVGNTTNLTATAHYSNGSTQVVTSLASWSSEDPSRATVGNIGVSKGYVTGVDLGYVNINASYGGFDATPCVVNVVPALVSIAITPVGPTIYVGETLQMTATGTYSNGVTQDITDQVAWTSGNPGVITVTNDGVIMGINAGAVTLGASLDGVSAPSMGVLVSDVPAWQLVGTEGFGVASTAPSVLINEFEGNPLVVFNHDLGGGSGEIKSLIFNGENWVAFGNGGTENIMSASGNYFSTTNIGGVPYIAICEYPYFGQPFKLSVMKRGETEWEFVGSARFSVGNALHTSLTSVGGQPVVSYCDVSESRKTTVQKFNGTNWEVLQVAGFSKTGYQTENTAVVADEDTGDIYVAMSLREVAYPYKRIVTAMKFNGLNWEQVGSEEIYSWSGQLQGTNVYLAINNGEVYLSHGNGASSIPAVAWVKKFNGSDWEDYGTQNFETTGMRLVFDNSGNLYAFTLQPTTAYKHNGVDWENAGSTGFTTTQGVSGAMITDVPYYASARFMDYLVSVWKYT